MTKPQHAAATLEPQGAQGIPRATIHRAVEWSDTDAAGHHHNSSILRWVEACESRLYRDLGIARIFGDCPRVQQTVNYTAKLWFGQKISASVYIDKVGTSSVTFGFEVHGEETEHRERELAAHGTIVTVYVDPETGKSAPWPEQIRSAFQSSSSAT